MSMLNTHGMMPVSAAGAGSGTAITISNGFSGLAAASLRGLGIALLVLTIVFAIGAIRGLLPRRAELRARRELAPVPRAPAHAAARGASARGAVRGVSL